MPGDRARHAGDPARQPVRATRADRRLRENFSTPLLAYQAEHDNERRWLTFDLLCGRVDRQHPLWGFFTYWAGVSETDLEFFLDGDGAPDIIGINHYLTSERFLDQRLQRYPEHLWGGNGQHRYADAEAVRVALPSDDIGPAARLREVWERYRRPIAVTEAHHGCTRDEQLRWLMEVWHAARTVRAEGADIRAVTLWSLLGTIDWNTLLTQRNNIYETGRLRRPRACNPVRPRSRGRPRRSLRRAPTTTRCSTSRLVAARVPLLSSREATPSVPALPAAPRPTPHYRRDRHARPRLLAHLRAPRA